MCFFFKKGKVHQECAKRCAIVKLLEFDTGGRRNVQILEISMWNLYKDMSFAAKCKYCERKTKFLPVTSQVKVNVLK